MDERKDERKEERNEGIGRRGGRGGGIWWIQVFTNILKYEPAAQK
jgi:hypothetical protein